MRKGKKRHAVSGTCQRRQIRDDSVVGDDRRPAGVVPIGHKQRYVEEPEEEPAAEGRESGVA